LNSQGNFVYLIMLRYGFIGGNAMKRFITQAGGLALLLLVASGGLQAEETQDWMSGIASPSYGVSMNWMTLA
jgi:hypothetical protein